MNQILCVGGPFAGRVVNCTREMRILQIPQWPKPETFIRASVLVETPIELPAIQYSHYRWHQATWNVSFGSMECVAMVHDSMTNREANMACASAFFAMLLRHGIEETGGAK